MITQAARGDSLSWQSQTLTNNTTVVVRAGPMNGRVLCDESRRAEYNNGYDVRAQNYYYHFGSCAISQISNDEDPKGTDRVTADSPWTKLIVKVVSCRFTLKLFLLLQQFPLHIRPLCS
jgi:hypothetical protein